MARVLIVDDKEYIVFSAVTLLENRGHMAFGAKNGHEGLAALAKDPQIVFLDYNMPGMDGFDFSVRVRTDPEYQRYASIPIVGIGQFPAQKICYLNETLAKPVPVDEFLRAIAKYCL